MKVGGRSSIVCTITNRVENIENPHTCMDLQDGGEAICLLA